VLRTPRRQSLLRYAERSFPRRPPHDGRCAPGALVKHDACV